QITLGVTRVAYGPVDQSARIEYLKEKVSMSRRVSVLLFVLVALMALTVSVSAQDGVTIRYQLWDTNQLPPYQQCADAFMAANPGITVTIEQLGWDDYWTG